MITFKTKIATNQIAKFYYSKKQASTKEEIRILKLLKQMGFSDTTRLGYKPENISDEDLNRSVLRYLCKEDIIELANLLVIKQPNKTQLISNYHCQLKKIRRELEEKKNRLLYIIDEIEQNNAIPNCIYLLFMPIGSAAMAAGIISSLYFLPAAIDAMLTSFIISSCFLGLIPILVVMGGLMVFSGIATAALATRIFTGEWCCEDNSKNKEELKALNVRINEKDNFCLLIKEVESLFMDETQIKPDLDIVTTNSHAFFSKPVTENSPSQVATGGINYFLSQ